MSFILIILIILIAILKLLKIITNKSEPVEINFTKDNSENFIEEVNFESIEKEIFGDEVKYKGLYSKARKHLDRINNLKSNFNEIFFPYKYTKEISEKVESYIKEYYDEEKKLILLLKEYHITTINEIPPRISCDIGEFFIYNMAQCYYSQNKFKEAHEVLIFGFDNMNLFDTSHNLYTSYENFLELLLNKKEINFFFYSIELFSKKIDLDEQFIENISFKIGRLLEIESFFILFIEALKVANKDNEIIKKIIHKSEIQIKIYKNLEYSSINFKGKNYEKALEYFEKAISNSIIYNENIIDMYELYGDILYKLKNYTEAIKIYQHFSENSEEKHRIFSKIGDCYKLLKENEKSYYYYILSLKFNPDYKTSQKKLLLISKKIDKNINLEEITKYLKNNPNSSLEELKILF